MIEVIHNPLNLPSKAIIKVKDARTAERLLNMFCDGKAERGYRLRFVPSPETNTIELGARKKLHVDMAIRCLQDSDLFISQVKFKNNTLLKRM